MSDNKMVPAQDVVDRLNATPEVQEQPHEAQKPVLVQPERIVKLDLACGQSPVNGFEGVDLLAPKADHKVDLLKFPWPWADNSVDELHCSHFIEHIPMEYVDAKHSRDIISYAMLLDMPHYGKDLLVAFFDECHRILKPGGTLRVIAPYALSTRAFQDPTHRRFIVYETFAYFSPQWRETNKLDHYRIDSRFDVNVTHTCDEMEMLKSQEAAMARFRYYNNVVGDVVALLKKQPPK